MIKLFGIKNCDTVKKARNFLSNNNVDFEFVDLRKPEISKSQIQGWCNTVEWSTILNQRSKTWRELDSTDKDDINKTKAISLMTKHPTLIKRPVLVKGKTILVGFNQDDYQKVCA